MKSINQWAMLVAVAFVGLGMWMAFHAKTLTDAAIFGYMAGMYGTVCIRIGGEQ